MEKNLIASFVLLFSFFAVFTTQAQKVDLGLNLQKGDTYFHDMVSNSKIDQKFGDLDINMEMEISGRMSFWVKEVNTQGYLMDVQYERMAMRLDLPMAEEVVFDSDSKDTEDVFSKIMGRIVKQPFGVRMSRSGKILEVLNIERMFDSMFDQFSEIPAEQLDQIKNQLQDAFGARAFKGSLEILTAILPEKPVAVGEKWNVQTDLMGMLDAKIDATFQLDQNGKEFRIITGKAQIKTNPDASVDGDIAMDLSGTMLSNIKVDPKTGWVIAASINQHIEGNSVIGPSEDMPDGMTIPMTLITNIEIKGK